MVQLDGENSKRMQVGARITLEGVVQGVGFRPFVHRIAKSYNLSGSVFNSAKGVVIEVEGMKERLQEFYREITTSPPPLAVILRKRIEFHPPRGLHSFEIKESKEDEDEFTPVSPDIGTCKECHSELFNQKDRRYKYPFINCTNCGPRFTIIEEVPYDRAKTTMRKFKMCRECREEYEDISNRRYHAQPNACKECGPKVWLWRDGKIVECKNPIKETIKLLKEGFIVAVKGLGGYHLACNAQDDKAVKLLRERKRRERSKPFAIMSKSLHEIRKYCEVGKVEETLLLQGRRPIVLLRKKEPSPISDFVAPRNKYFGVMLPYTPLHYLLFEDSSILALVMTSGNPSDEPLTKDNEEAAKRLSGIADYILMHNRDIYNRCDDSVTQVVLNEEVIIRRGRGYAPFPISLNFHLPELLAVGAELKNTFCLTRATLAFISQHIGDLHNMETLQFFKETFSRYKNLFRINPIAVAHDIHPDYLSTKYAKELVKENPQLKAFGVQHHHAHIASCMAENGVDEEVIGVAMDGIGYGTDGAIWGCEFMIADYYGFERVAHLKYIPMPGGDKATLQPWRMTLSYLHSLFGEEIPKDFIRRFGEKETSTILRMISNKINSPLTSSAGRLFDAVSSLIGLRDVIDYEAQAAVELEMVARAGERGEYGFELISNEVLVIDPTLIIAGILYDIKKGLDASIISSKFHNTVVNFILQVVKEIRERRNIKKVALSGGVFQNRLLLEQVKIRLRDENFLPLLHTKVPPNDGGISLGQAVIAGRRSECALEFQQKL